MIENNTFYLDWKLYFPLINQIIFKIARYKIMTIMTSPCARKNPTLLLGEEDHCVDKDLSRVDEIHHL